MADATSIESETPATTPQLDEHKLLVTNGLRSAIAVAKDRLQSHGLRSAIGKPAGPVETPMLDREKLISSHGPKAAIGTKPV